MLQFESTVGPQDKRGVRSHPFHLPWLRHCDEGSVPRWYQYFNVFLGACHPKPANIGWPPPDGIKMPNVQPSHAIRRTIIRPTGHSDSVLGLLLGKGVEWKIRMEKVKSGKLRRNTEFEKIIKHNMFSFLYIRYASLILSFCYGQYLCSTQYKYETQLKAHTAQRTQHPIPPLPATKSY